MLNKIMFIGHIGRDPEIRYAASGSAVCNFSVAASEKWKDKATGEMKESTEWLRCSAFDRLAEVCGEYLKKGSLVYVEGKLKTRKYSDKEGVERYVTECHLQTMKMMGGKPESSEPRTQQTAPRPAARPIQTQAPAATGFSDMDDDVPFILSLNEYTIASSKERRMARCKFK